MALRHFAFKCLIATALACAVTLHSACESGAVVDGAARVRVGSHLDLGNLQLLDGSSRPVVTAENRATLLAFWATWCPYCKEEVPGLSRFQAAERENGIEVIGVNSGESARRIRAFLEDTPIPYPIALDRGQALMNRFGIQSLPAIVLVDRRGVVRYMGEGLPDVAGLETSLAAR